MYNDLVLKILTIIDYKEDKKAFIADFDRIINSQALVDLMQSLPEEQRKEADTTIASSDSPETFTQNVHKYFSDEQVQNALDTAAAQAITQWITSIADTLTEEQRDQLVALSQELQEKISTK